MWLNTLALSEAMTLPGQTVELTRYFTSRIDTPADKAKRQDQYLQAIADLGPRSSIHYGKYLSSTATCRNCKHTYLQQSEKMTDVNIAVSLVEDAFLDRFDTALLVSGDSDLCPPIDLVKRLFPKKRIIVGFPPDRVSNLLRRQAHATFPIGESKFRRSQFPDTVTTSSGFRLHRPANWV